MNTTTTTRRRTTDAAPAPDWASAACRQVDPELFFPTAHTRGWRAQTKQAKQVCNRCPVRDACRNWALDTGQSSGVWGGLSEAERRQIARVPFSQMAVCWEHRELIEKQAAAGVSYRQIGELLGIGHSAVTRAMAIFREQRAGEGVAA